MRPLSARNRLLVLSLAALAWAAYIVFMAGFRHSFFMDPFLLVWLVVFFVAGPILALKAVAGLVRIGRSPGRPMPALAINVAVLGIVVCLSFGFWTLGDLLRPRLFLSVSAENESVARVAMATHPEHEQFILSGFRYPYCRLFGVPSRHEDGILWVLLPGKPGPKDYILYDPRRRHIGPCEHMGGPWYIERAEPSRRQTTRGQGA